MPYLPHDEATTPGETYFDLDGDRDILEAKSSLSEMHLTWRGDPNETGSDWSIVIVTNELQTTTYHVHKSVLCFGSRLSKYFARVMLNSTPKKSKSQKSANNAPSTKVELNQKDADNFPILLDFIYAPAIAMSSNGTVMTAASTHTFQSFLSVPSADDETASLTHGETINTHNAVSLRHLARRFEVEALMMAVNRFIQKDLNFKTGPQYLSKASEYKDERLVESAQRLCAENIEQIDVKSLIRLPLHLFRVVIKSLETFDEDNKELSYFLSEVVCRYLEKHPKSRSSELVLELTDSLLMPYIAPEAAIGYTAILKNLDTADAARHWTGLVQLSRRCARAVVQEYGWGDFSVDAAVDEYLGNLESTDRRTYGLDSLLFATSFAAALEQAQDDFEEIVVEQERLESMVGSMHDSITALEKTNQRKDDLLTKQQRAIEEARKQIAVLKDELRRQQLNGSFDGSGGDPAVNDLVAPSQVGLDVHAKTRRMKELRSMNEMRSRSLLL